MQIIGILTILCKVLAWFFLGHSLKIRVVTWYEVKKMHLFFHALNHLGTSKTVISKSEVKSLLPFVIRRLLVTERTTSRIVTRSFAPGATSKRQSSWKVGNPSKGCRLSETKLQVSLAGVLLSHKECGGQKRR